MKMGTTASHKSPKILLQNCISEREVRHWYFTNVKNIIYKKKQTFSSTIEIVISDHKEVMKGEKQFFLALYFNFKRSVVVLRLRTWLQGLPMMAGAIC